MAKYRIINRVFGFDTHDAIVFSAQRLPQLTRQALWRTVSPLFTVAASGAASALDENGKEIALLNATAEPIFAAVVTVSRREICVFKISCSLFFIISTLIASKGDLNLYKTFPG
ncbi:hypothetical protein EGT84_16370 [Atlantibacter subterranea]|nr:hypothetical protein EGK67_09730 [Atlantibacter subterranea]RSE03519.1 hypothetical protein EGT84_16370 [Atlantibacter subterranea]